MKDKKISENINIFVQVWYKAYGGLLSKNKAWIRHGISAHLTVKYLNLNYVIFVELEMLNQTLQ